MWARRLQLYWLPIGTTLAVGAAALLLDLPARAASLDGPQGGYWPWIDASALLGWSMALLVALWTLQAVTDKPRRPSPFAHPAYYFASAILFVDALAVVGGRATPAEPGVAVWAAAGILPAALLGNHLAAKLEDARARSEGGWDAGPARRPILRLRRTEAALWVGRRETWGYPASAWLGVLLYGALVMIHLEKPGGFRASDVILVSQAILAVYWLTTMTVRVTVTQAAVRVQGGPLPLRSWTIPLEDVVEARVEAVRPRHYAGYGYRAKGGRRCLIVRAGDALVLRRRAGRDFVVTVGDAERGAALVNALVQRRALARVS